MAAFRHTLFVCRGKSEVALEYMPFFYSVGCFFFSKTKGMKYLSVMKFNETVVVDS